MEIVLFLDNEFDESLGPYHYTARQNKEETIQIDESHKLNHRSNACTCRNAL